MLGFYSCRPKYILVESLCSKSSFLLQIEKNAQKELEDIVFYEKKYVKELYYMDSVTNSMQNIIVRDSINPTKIYAVPPFDFKNINNYQKYLCADDTIGDINLKTGLRYWYIDKTELIQYKKQKWNVLPTEVIYNRDTIFIHFPIDTIIDFSFESIKTRKGCNVEI
jgi:hypothetical protein